MVFYITSSTGVRARETRLSANNKRKREQPKKKQSRDWIALTGRTISGRRCATRSGVNCNAQRTQRAEQSRSNRL
jgi:hypothetical protein